MKVYSIMNLFPYDIENKNEKSPNTDDIVIYSILIFLFLLLLANFI